MCVYTKMNIYIYIYIGLCIYYVSMYLAGGGPAGISALDEPQGHATHTHRAVHAIGGGRGGNGHLHLWTTRPHNGV
jgi:hypothetical protein